MKKTTKKKIEAVITESKQRYAEYCKKENRFADATSEDNKDSRCFALENEFDGYLHALFDFELINAEEVKELLARIGNELWAVRE